MRETLMNVCFRNTTEKINANFPLNFHIIKFQSYFYSRILIETNYRIIMYNEF